MLDLKQQQALNASIGNITNFVMSNKGKCMPWADSREKLFRYVAHCFVFGKISVSWHDKAINAVVFYWPVVFERLEAQVEQGQPVFSWEPTRQGDSLFVADCIGNRQAIGRLWHGVIEKWPHLIQVPIYTFRRGKLHKLDIKTLERYAP